MTLLVVRIDGESMTPSYQSGDAVLIVRHRVGRAVRRGDVVLCRLPAEFSGPGGCLVKRVTAVEGDTIAGVPPGPARRDVVPSGQVYVQGDSKHSYDSRAFGSIPLQCVLGRVVARLTLPDNRPTTRPGWVSNPKEA